MNAKTVTVDLRYNNISNINFFDLNQYQPDTDGYRVDILISNNKIHCDCNSLDLARYVQENDHSIKETLVLKYDRLECFGPEKLSGISLEKVPLDELTCDVGRNCTSNQTCNCTYRSSDRTLIVDCSNRTLVDVPELNQIPTDAGIDRIEVNLQDNLLQRCPSELDGYENTSVWNLKGNLIRNVTWIPEVLDVSLLIRSFINLIFPNFLHRSDKKENIW